MVNKLVDIKTGQPVTPSPSHGNKRATLMQDGKRWAKLKELHEQGGFSMSTISGEFTFDEIAVNLDALSTKKNKTLRKPKSAKSISAENPHKFFTI